MVRYVITITGYFLSPYLGEAAAAARAALPVPTSVCSIFLCPNSGMTASVWDCWLNMPT